MPTDLTPTLVWALPALLAACLVLMVLRTLGAELEKAVGRARLVRDARRLREKQLTRLAEIRRHRQERLH